MDPDQQLDVIPDDGLDAAAVLEQLAGIAHRAGLLRMERRLRAVGKWATGIAMADLELLDAQVQAEEVVAAQVRAEPVPVEVLNLPATTVNRKTPEGLAHAIVEALGRGPMIIGRLAKTVKASQADVTRWLAHAKKDGLVRRIGYRWELATTSRPAVPAPVEKRTLADAVTVPRATSPAEVSGAGPTCKRCDDPFSDHDPETGKCYGKKGKCVCLEFYA